MASAMIGGMVKNGAARREDIIASVLTDAGKKRVEEELGIRVTKDNREVAGDCDVLFLAVKPQFYEQVIKEIADKITQEQIIVTIAPGKTLEWLASLLGNNKKIVRTMPNTPALVGEGMTAACCNENVTEEDLAVVTELLESFGKCEVVPEQLMDVVVSVSGSSPAYVFLFIEAMADGAVADGMPREQAYRFAAQAVLGSAKMVLDTGKHPGELKDMVCSPGGTTMEAVRVLEQKGLRSSVIEAMKSCVAKARGL